MADLLTIGASSTNTFKKAIEVTSHNVANVATDGYNRQRTEISSNTTSALGSSFNGGGSTVDSVERVYASYIQKQLTSAYSSMSRYEEQLSLAQQVEGVVAGSDEGVQEFMQRLFDSFQSLADNPTSTTSRQLVLDESENLESLIGNMYSVLEDTQDQVNGQITDLVSEVNTRLDAIKMINEQVSVAYNTGNQAPNDLLDQRDQAILELSEYVDIKTYELDDGQIAVYTGGGNLPLVTDNIVTYLQAGLSEYSNENRMEVYMNVGGEPRIISDQISQGELGAVLDFRDNMLDQAMNELGVTLNGLTASANWQHYQGYDENGDAGGNLYQPLTATALASSKNATPGLEDGSNITVSFNPNAGVAEPPYTAVTQPATYGDKETYLDNAYTAIGEFEAREYEIRVNAAGDFEVYDYKEGGAALATIPFGGAAEIDGLYFDLSSVAAGTVASGDKFVIKPHQQMLDDFETVLTDPDLIATRGQSPVDTDSDGSLLDEVPAPAAEGDNVNIANMANLSSKSLLYSDVNGNPSETLLGGYSRMATSVGTYVSSTEIQLTAQTNVYDQILSRRESISGVSLDEEAANLVRYQQAYEASAQIIQAAQSMFQTLISAVRG